MTIKNKNLIHAYKKGYRIINNIIWYKGKRLKGGINSNGYRCFYIRSKANKSKPVLVHRLVAYQKYGRKIFNKKIQVRHHDGNKLNNFEKNILIGTSSQNHMDKSPKVRLRAAIIASKAIKIHNHKRIISLYKKGASYTEIMGKMNIGSKGTINFIIRKSIQSKK